MYNAEAHDALTNKLAKVWARKHLYVLFIQAVAEADQSLFLEMATKCRNKDGYDAYNFYDTKTNSLCLSHAGEINILTSLFSSQDTDEVVTAGKQMRFQNEQLSEADRLSDKVLVMALLTKLSHEYTEFVKIYLHGSRLPSFSELLKSIEDESTINSLRGGGTSRIALMSHRGGGGGKPSPAYACRNCSVKGDHWGHECPKPIVHCGVCNRSGYMEQFCWVKNKYMKLPESCTGEAPANISKMCEAYHLPIPSWLAARSFKFLATLCHYLSSLTIPKLLQVCRVSRRRMRDVVFLRRPISMRDVVLPPYDQGAIFFLFLVLLLCFDVPSLSCCSPQQGGVEDRTCDISFLASPVLQCWCAVAFQGCCTGDRLRCLAF